MSGSTSRLAVVTGATGHIGANVVRALLAEERHVRVLTHASASGLDGVDVERARGDVTDAASLRAAFDGASVVYHCAGVISVDGDRDGTVHRVNVEGTRNVARACLDAKVRRLIHFSSIQAYAQNGRGVLDESAPLALGPEHYAYDASKARAEAALRELGAQGLDFVALSPTAVIGPHDYRPSRMGRAVLDLAQGRLIATVDGGCDFVDVRDVAAAALAAEKLGRPGQSYMLGGEWHRIAELAQLVHELTAARRPGFDAPMWLARAGAPFVTAFARIRGVEPLFTSQTLTALRSHRNLSCARARDDLGYAPRPFEQTVADTLRWFRDVGMLPDAIHLQTEATT